MSLRIEDYGLIGDCETAALVSRQGSIDWLCWPHFAGPTCFATLLGTQENGYWSISPREPFHTSRRYLDHTLILETTFKTAHGLAVLLDFMPIRDKNSCVIRILRGLEGKVPISMRLTVRFDYGRTVPWVTRMEDGALRAIAGPDMVLLRTPAPLHGENHSTRSDFTISAGESIPFVLAYGPSYAPPPKPLDAERALRETMRYWKGWASRANLQIEYADAIERSLITLKALTYRPTGGIVAAPTTSLPEQLGGPRNWDYRYCWLRDATFTLLALMNAGYFDEARAWGDWLLRAVAGNPEQVQIMYTIRGERNLLEWEVNWLAGYEDSKPVRIGNAASEQLQLDVFGEIADAFLHARMAHLPRDSTAFSVLRALTNHLAKIWQLPDEGIWEVRGGPKHFTYSKVMAWVAFDRGIRAAEQFGKREALSEWRKLREKIHAEVCEQGYNRQLGCFTQFYGSKELDASLLLVPLVGFLPPSDPRVRRTVEAIEKHLMSDGFVLRYRTESGRDGLPGGEGAFLACSFWMVSALQMLGRTEDARRLFERLLSIRNDLGLLAEEYSPQAQRQVGNFPQALSHIALVNSAFELTRATSPGKQRAGCCPVEPNGASQPRNPGKKEASFPA